MDAQTAREALIGELIGDVDTLIARADALRTTVPEAAERAASRLETAGNRLRAELARDGEALHRSLREITREADTAARIVDGASRRLIFLAVLAGFGGGIVGGALAGVALARWMSL